MKSIFEKILMTIKVSISSIGAVAMHRHYNVIGNIGFLSLAEKFQFSDLFQFCSWFLGYDSHKNRYCYLAYPSITPIHSHCSHAKKARHGVFSNDNDNVLNWNFYFAVIFSPRYIVAGQCSGRWHQITRLQAS